MKASEKMATNGKENLINKAIYLRERTENDFDAKKHLRFSNGQLNKIGKIDLKTELISIILLSLIIFMFSPSLFSSHSNSRSNSRSISSIISNIIPNEKAREKACVSNMRTMESAMEMYQMENNNSIPNFNDLAPYMQHQVVPKCPDGGTYTIEEDTDGYLYIRCSAHGTSINSHAAYDTDK